MQNTTCGFDTNELLAYPPDDLKIDLLIMHSYGRHVGKQAQVITDAKKCKWVLVVHTISEELEKYMKAVASSSGFKESEHELQVNLCEKADLVLAVGPQVARSLQGCTATLWEPRQSHYTNAQHPKRIPGCASSVLKMIHVRSFSVLDKCLSKVF